jgi:serine/threonine protein kinase
MQYFKVVKILVILNILIQTTNAFGSYVIEEEPQKALHHSSSKKVTTSSWSLSDLWQSFQQTVSTKLLPYVFDFEKSSPSKVTLDPSWWKTPSFEEGEFSHKWHSIVTHIIKENLKQAQTLAYVIQERENYYKSNEGQNLSRHKKLLKLLGKKAQRIASYDELLIQESKKISLPQYLKFLASFNLEEKNLPLLREVLKEFYSKVGQTSLKNDFYDGELFQKGSYLADCLWEIGTLERHPKNLSKLKSIVLSSYKSIEKDELDDFVFDELKSLGIISPPTRNFGGTQMVSGSLLLLLMLSNNIINVSAAIPRSVALGTACSDAYKQCESGFTLFEFYNSTLEINSILSNSYFMNATQQTLLESNRLTALNSTLNNIDNLMNTTGWYSEVTAYSVSSIPTGTATREIYSLPAPFRGGSRTPINDTAYHQDAYSIYDIYQPKNITNNYTFSGTMNYYFLDQFPNTEVWLFSVMINQSFGLGTAIMRPSQGAPSVLWQRSIVRESAINTVSSSSLIGKVINANKPARATLEDNNTFDNMTSLYSGNVGQPDCQGEQTIEQYLNSQPLTITSLSNELLTCMPEPILDPLGCFGTSGNYAVAYTRISTFFMENLLGNLTYHHKVADGPSFKACSYQELNSQETQETCHTYLWFPQFSNIKTTSQVLPQNFSSLYGTLKLGELRKVAEIFFSDTSVEGIILETLQNKSGVFGPNYYAYCASKNPNNSTGDGSSSSSDASVLGGAIGGSLGGAALITCAAATGAIIYRHKHNKKNAFDKEDIEMNARSSGINTVPRDVFGAKEQGLEDARLRVTGAMHGLRYGLYFNIDKAEAQEINAQTGLKIDVPKDEEEIPFHLGAGNFGRVILAKEETGHFRAMKIVAGTKNVKASLREGRLQARLGEKEGVLPLLEYLHFAPTGKNKKEMKQLLVATFGSSVLQGEDMTSQELLLQVTPLAAFGNGETFQKSLASVSNKKLKDQLLNHFALSLLTGLKNMHDDGVSHLDIKPSNILMHRDGTVYVSDFGCALQKDNLRGGIGDFRYFSPDRIAHSRLLMHRRGHEYEATEMVPHFSGKAADAFATGLTLLEIATNDYPLGREASVTDMINVRDSDYFDERLEDVYEGVSKKLSILTVIKGLLHSKPKKRWTTLKAYEVLSELKLKSSPRELFRAFDKELSEEKVESHTREAVNTNVDPSEDSGTSSSYMYENKLPSQHAPQAYGQELPSLYKELQQDYSEGDLSLNSSNDNDKEDSTDPYTVPELNPFNSDESTYMDTGLKFKS